MPGPISGGSLSTLRANIDTKRVQAGLQPYNWTDSLNSGTPIKAAHFQELRTATLDLWFRKNMAPLPDWTTSPGPNTGTKVAESYALNPETWLDTYSQSSNSQRTQGIVSAAVGPGGSIVNSAWCADGAALKPSGTKLLLRTPVSTSENSQTPADPAKYVTAANRWPSVLGSGSVGLVIPHEFYNFNTISNYANAPLTTNNGLGNAYIDEYISRLDAFAQVVVPAGITTFWVWNEPQAASVIPQSGVRQDIPKILAPENFAAICHRGAVTLKNRGASKVYVGSLNILTEQGVETGASHAWGYISKMYEHLRNDPRSINASPWDGFWLNIELPQTSAFSLNYIDNTMKVGFAETFTTWNERNANLLISEWGIRATDTPLPAPGQVVPQVYQDTFNNLKSRFPVMYYFSHQYYPDSAHPDETYGLTNIDDTGSVLEMKNLPGKNDPYVRYPDNSSSLQLWEVIKALVNSQP